MQLTHEKEQEKRFEVLLHLTEMNTKWKKAYIDNVHQISVLKMYRLLIRFVVSETKDH